MSAHAQTNPPSNTINHTKLSVLQYNTQASKDKVLQPLPLDPAINTFDVLAILEPWPNPSNRRTTLSPPPNFSLAHGGHENARTCFYISKRLPLYSWNCFVPPPDLAIVDITTADNQVLRIANVYSPSPTSFAVALDEYANPLAQAMQLCSGHPGPSVLLGDFNLWNPDWAGQDWLQTHQAAQDLASTASAGLSLLTIPGTKTRQGPTGRATTIDLAFGNRPAADAVLRYGVATSLDHGSDHLPLQLVLHLAPPPTPHRTRPWRALNETHASRLAAEIPFPAEGLRVDPTPAAIDQYALALQRFCQQVLWVCSPSPPPGPTSHRARLGRQLRPWSDKSGSCTGTRWRPAATQTGTASTKPNEPGFRCALSEARPVPPSSSRNL